MSLAEAFPNGPDVWLAQRIKDLMENKDQLVIYKLCDQAAVPVSYSTAAVVWELHCTKLAISQFQLVLAAHA